MHRFRTEAVKELREREGLSMEVFAQKLGVSKQVVSTWETGACEPRVKSLLKLSDVYSVPFDFFFLDSVTTVVKKAA